MSFKRYAVMRKLHFKNPILSRRHVFFPLIFLFLLGFSQQTVAQDNSSASRVITGRVTGEKGEPLVGVTVQEKGAGKSMITDSNGAFSIDVKKDVKSLIFSYVGMERQEIPVVGKSTINVTMVEASIGLDTVSVAIGYGTMKKSDLTGSVVKADLESFREQPNTNIMQSLQGSVPGLNVGMSTTAGSTPSLSIRGLNSLSGSTDPLIVLDGTIYHGNISDINPDDIESIDVLKDASSTAIYGSQAANGVLIITSKRGQKAGKPVLNYSAYYTTQQPSNMLTPLNRDEYIQKVKDASWQQSRLAPDYTTPNPDYKLAFIYQTVADGYVAGTNTNWLDLISQDSYIQNQNISVSGNNGGSNYYISTSFADQAGYIINDKYKRWTVRINLENKVNNWLTIGTQAFSAFDNYSGASPDIRGAYLLSPLVSPYESDGKTLNLYPQGPVDNPLMSSEQDDLDKRLNLFGNFYGIVKLPFIKGLTYRVNYSNDYRVSRHFNFDKYAQNLQGSGYKNYATDYDWTIDNILNYETSFNDVHNLNATLVYGREKRQCEGTNSSSAIFTNMALGYNGLGNGNIDQQTVSTTAYEENSLYSMARLQYDFKHKYFLTSTIRRDGFSGFGANKKIGYFPSVAVAWTASEERFVKNNLPIFNFLKFRASYGESGNRTVGRYGTLARMSSEYVYVYGNGGSPVIGQTISSMQNSNLGWETTEGLNLGIDFGILSQRIRGSVDYYSTNTRDILYDIQIPTITGFSTITTNIGKVHNWGIEALVTSTNIKTQNFQWESTIDFSLNRNEVVSILGLDNNHDGKEDDLISSGLFIGKSRGAIYSYNVLGLYQLGDANIMAGYYPGTYKMEDLNGDGTISAAMDRKILGYSLPSYRFSLLNSFKYKNWTLRAFINSIQGGKHYYYGNNTPQSEGAWISGDNIANWNIVKEWNYWTPENPNAEYRRLDKPGAIDPAIYRQRNFIRLQDVSLSYDFKKNFLNKLNFKTLKVYASGKNLYTWTKWKGLDPETGIGIAPGGYPVLRSYTFGVNLLF